jgi:hypothetical protein
MDIIDAMPYHLSILDENGNICFVNKAWKDFAAEHECPEENAGVGKSFIHFCGNKECVFRDQEGRAHAELKEVIDGKKNNFTFEYECGYSKRWFLVKGTAVKLKGKKWIIMYHQEITKQIKEEEVKINEKIDYLMSKINSILPPNGN